MPGPYEFPVTVNPGDPGVTDWAEQVGAALNEAAPAATPNVLVLRDAFGRAQVADPVAAGDVATKAYVDANGGGGGGGSAPVQYVPNVGGTFSSGFWVYIATTSLRSQSSTAMPLLVVDEISIDQASFEVTTIADAATTADINLVKLVSGAWTVEQALVTGIDVSTDKGWMTSTFTPVTLTPGLWGLQVREPGSTWNAALKVRSGKINGPGCSWDQLPVGTNGAIVASVPIVTVRRSA